MPLLDGRGLKDVIAAKARGVRVTCEVTPHHLFFDDSMLNDENRLWLQMNPPLRGREDRLAMIEALRTGGSTIWRRTMRRIRSRKR